MTPARLAMRPFSTLATWLDIVAAVERGLSGAAEALSSEEEAGSAAAEEGLSAAAVRGWSAAEEEVLSAAYGRPGSAASAPAPRSGSAWCASGPSGIPACGADPGAAVGPLGLAGVDPPTAIALAIALMALRWSRKTSTSSAADTTKSVIAAENHALLKSLRPSSRPKRKTPTLSAPKMPVVRRRYRSTARSRVLIYRGVAIIAAATGPSVKMANPTCSQSSKRSVNDMP